MKIWVVQGQTGEYSDRQEWLVNAYTAEARAQEIVAALDAKLLEFKIRYEDSDCPPWEEREAIAELMKQLDPDFQCDYTGTRYSYVELELE